MSNPQLNPDWLVEEVEQPTFDAEGLICAVIEPKIWPEWEALLLRYFNEPRTEALFAGTDYESIQHGPMLLDVTTSRDYHAALFPVLEEMPAGAIFTAAPGVTWKEIIALMKNRLTVVSGSHPQLLRFYEPRVLLPLIGAMDEADRAQFMPGMTSVFWHHRHWLQAKLSEGKTEADAQLREKRWRISEQHEQKMQSIYDQWA